MPSKTQRFAIGSCELSLLQGDITRVRTDAMGNAANSELMGGGGVDGAIHRAGGESIMEELDEIRERIGSCPPGQVVATGAGRLPAKWVLHAVGPIYMDGDHGESEILAACYRECLCLAGQLGAESLTLPAISTGVFGFPLDQAADIAVRAVADALSTRKTGPGRVTFVLFNDTAYEAFERSAKEIVPQFA